MTTLDTLASADASIPPQRYWYSPNGYLWYRLPAERFAALPETIEVAGEMFKRKSEFHVTIVHGRSIARDVAGDDEEAIARIEQELQALLADYLRKTPMHIDGFEDDLRLAITSERMSIVARCRMQNLEGYFDAIEATYGKRYPTQPAHVSLYTRTGLAVGIDSTEQMESYKKIELPEVQKVLNGIGALA